MNKFHVLLLPVLCAVSGANAAEFSVHALATSFQNLVNGKNVKQGDDLVEVVSANSYKSKTLLKAGKDALVYTYAPDVVGKAAAVANFITPACVKKYIPAVPTVIANRMPNAVNAENANRVLTEGLVSVLMAFINPVQVSESGRVAFVATVPLTKAAIKADAKFAINNMKDAGVAITAVELLSYAGNKIVTKAGGERGEKFIADYAGWLEYAKVASYAVFKQLSAACTPVVF